jgi:hypothetical protein
MPCKSLHDMLQINVQQQRAGQAVLTCANLRIPDRSNALRDIVTLAMGPSLFELVAEAAPPA